MCEICDGATWDEAMAGIDDRIARFGFTMQGIEPDPDHPPWAFTIGLRDDHHHPELSVLGLPFPVACHLLGQLAGAVCAGERFHPGEQVRVRDVGHFYVRAVPPEVWYGEMFDGWRRYYAWRGDAPESGAVELVPRTLPEGPGQSLTHGLNLLPDR